MIVTKSILYIIEFLIGRLTAESNLVFYGSVKDAPACTRVIIIPSGFFDEASYGSKHSLPETPFRMYRNIPILFGIPRIEKDKIGRIIFYADIIASSFFLLTRYEEILKLGCRDRYGRFLAGYSIIFQQGYGLRPLVDEYGVLLRDLLRESGVDVPKEKHELTKIFLTHDVDNIYKYDRFSHVVRQWIKNLLHFGPYRRYPLRDFLCTDTDEYYKIHEINNYDRMVKKALINRNIEFESLFFLITAGSYINSWYYNFSSKKIDAFIAYLKKTGVNIGLHLSLGAGAHPKKICYEAKKLRKKIMMDGIKSRHHYLCWQEPEDVVFLERAGISDDFTITYADCAGFRVGTCRPYHFINPRTKELTKIIIHPLEIMDVSLGDEKYMNLNYDEAFEKCKYLISQVQKYNGELVMLFHNGTFIEDNYYERLYKNLINYIIEII
jgi:hypothetical protein